ncbi:MAG TPA: VanZ family protein [Bacilli bacterium]|nr:VanZ family protein [Bacilli bacterium]
MYIEMFNKAISSVWPMLFIFSVILILMRIAYLYTHRDKMVLYEEVLKLVFILYILLLYYVVTFQDVNYNTSNFVPFKEIFRYKLLSTGFFKNILGNVILFIPFGMYITYYLETKKIYLPIIITVLTSITIEFAQYKIGRTADVDDVILNIIGGILGYILYKIIHSISNRLPRSFRSQTFLNFITIILIAVITLYLSGFKFWGIIK